MQNDKSDRNSETTIANGSSPLALIIDDRPCLVEPGEVAVVSWQAEPSEATVSISITDGETQYACMTDQPSSGVMEWIAPRSMNKSREVTLCGTVEHAGDVLTQEYPLLLSTKPKLRIEGLEITQGIQTFDRMDGTPPNSLRHVLHKDTIVRVYISADWNGLNNDHVEDVTGVLMFDEVPLSPINGQVPDSCGSWSGGDPFITARPVDQINRQRANHTLNFRIPAAMLTSSFHDIEVNITAPEYCGESAFRYFIIWGRWTDVEPLPVRYIQVNAGGQMPTADEAECTIVRAFDMLPSPATNIGPARVGTVETSLDLTDSSNLKKVLRDIIKLRLDTTLFLLSLDQDLEIDIQSEVYEWWTTIWVSVHDFGFMGWAPIDGNTCIAGAYEPLNDPAWVKERVSAAHEIGHLLGFNHVDIGCPSYGLSVSDADDYYNPANDGRLWDAPFDPFLNTSVLTPLSTSSNIQVADFMSYYCWVWPSGESWQQMYFRINAF